jgi:hypothetical protein
MATFADRVIGAARLDARIYEEVEADRQSTRQAVVVVLFASVAGGVGLLGLESSAPELVLARIAGLVAMIVAVRQALDYRHTFRAIAVCAVGWGLSLAVAAVIGNAFAPVVS